MKYLVIFIFVLISSVGLSQSLRFEGFHSEEYDGAGFEEEKTMGIIDLDKKILMFSSERGVYLEFKITTIDATTDGEFGSIVVSDGNIFVGVHNSEDSNVTLLIVKGKIYSGLLHNN